MWTKLAQMLAGNVRLNQPDGKLGVRLVSATGEVRQMLTRQEYLKAMGIEVWRLRRPLPEPDALDPRQTHPVEVSSADVAAVQAMPRSSQAEDSALSAQASASKVSIPRFRLALLHYKTVALVVSLEEKMDPPKRLCDDIARLLGGDLEGLRYRLLEWPMLNTSGIDQSLSSARQVVTQKFGQLPNKVLIFGSEVSDYFGAIESLVPGKPGKVGRQSFIVVPSLLETMSSASAKRALMLSLYQWGNA